MVFSTVVRRSRLDTVLALGLPGAAGSAVTISDSTVERCFLQAGANIGGHGATRCVYN